MQPTPPSKSSRFLSNARTWAYWLLPSLICLALHRDALRAWYWSDDFAWLGLNVEYADPRIFWTTVFQPAVQGNIRPISERLFFYALWHWFGWNALPAHILAMITQCVNLALFSAIVRRASGSAFAGAAAAVLWVANSALASSMSWACAYEELLVAFCILTALTFWIRFLETGKLVFYFGQLIFFLIGFGVLELNLMYPGLAAAWAFFYHRKRMVWSVPLFVISAAYYKLHTVLAPLSSAGAYHPHFDFTIVTALAQYWKLAFVPPYGFIIAEPVLGSAMVISASLCGALFLFFEIRHRRYAAVFFACWFVIALSPLLPFSDHLTPYYLTIPLAGLGAVMALALVRWKRYAAPIIACYLIIQLPTLSLAEHWLMERSLEARTLVMGVKQVHEWEPTKVILLTGVSKLLYGTTIADTPFRLMPKARVYLAPELLPQLTELAPNLAPPSRFTLAASPTREALRENRLVVYSADAVPAPLREITAAYKARTLSGPEPELPHLVDAGSPLLSYLLGPEWYPIENTYRWMPHHATLRIAGPRNATQRLYVQGYTSVEALRPQPLSFTVTIDGEPGGSARLGPSDLSFLRDFALPANSIGKPSIEISVEANRSFGKDRELSLVFGTFEVR